jgi:hypothetical protein
VSKANPDDMIWLVEQIVAATEAAGEEQFTISTSMVRALLEMAKRAPGAHKGRQEVTGRARVREAVVLAWARRRKAALIAEGMSPGKAHEQAAEEAAATLQSRNLAPPTIARRMWRRRRS